MSGKRSFYADDEETITTPGLNTQIPDELKSQESSHGNISFIEGMSIRTIPKFETQLNKLRVSLYDNLNIGTAELNTQLSAISNEFNIIKNEYNSIINEPILPNLIYILTASLTGSILVNRRLLPIRFITPVIFGGVAFNYFMPKSFNNAENKFINFEQKNYPDLYKQQLQFRENMESYKKQFKNELSDAELNLQKNIHISKNYISDLLSDEEKK